MVGFPKGEGRDGAASYLKASSKFEEAFVFLKRVGSFYLYRCIYLCNSVLLLFKLNTSNSIL